jgi:hypothetical protein
MSFVSDIIGSVIGSDASRHAANTQSDAAKYAADTQERMYDKGVALQEPWRQAGIGALSQLSAGTGAGGDFMRDFSAADFQQDPGYQFRMQQGQRALEASAAARGGLLSGGTGKNLVDYGQNFASNEYSNAYNRFNADRDRRFGRLSQLAGIGQVTSRDVANQGNDAASRIGEYSTQIGNAQAAGTIGQANAIARGVGSIGQWWQQSQNPSSQYPGSSFFRSDDPYRIPGYFGGSEGE